MFREDLPVLFTTIPVHEGQMFKNGNGGALGQGLTLIQDQLSDLKAKYPHLEGKELSDLRIVFVQGGGFGEEKVYIDNIVIDFF